MEDLEKCPVCDRTGSLLKNYGSLKDYALTGERFSVSRCSNCTVLCTDPRPAATEIGRYYDFPKYVSHSDEAPGLINKLYQLARRYTTRQKLKLINAYRGKASPIATLLDYGCGTGYFLHAALKNGWNALGVEVSDVARGAAAARTGQVVSGNLEELSATAFFDVISLWHVLEHIHELDKTIQTLFSHLAPDGTLLIAIPNPESLDAKVYQEWWAAYDVPRHLYHFSAKSVKELVARNNAEVIKQIGQPLDAFYIGLLSEKYRKRSSLWGLVNGLKSNINAVSTGNYSSIIYVVKKKRND